MLVRVKLLLFAVLGSFKISMNGDVKVVLVHSCRTGFYF